MTDELTPDEGAEATQEPDRPEWLPERFKNPEDLVRSWEESTRKISDQGQELSSLREEFDSLAEQFNVPQQQQQFYGQQQPDPMQHPLIAAYSQAMEAGDYGNAALLQAELNRQYAEANAPKVQEPEPDLGPVAALAEMQLRQRYGQEYDQFAQRASEILTLYPHLVPNGSLDGVMAGTETALRLAKEEALSQQAKSLAQQQAEQEQARQRKLAAQTATGAGGRPQTADEQSDLWNRIKNSDAGSRFRL